MQTVVGIGIKRMATVYLYIQYNILSIKTKTTENVCTKEQNVATEKKILTSKLMQFKFVI